MPHNPKNGGAETYRRHVENLSNFLHSFIKEDMLKKLHRFFKKTKISDDDLDSIGILLVSYTNADLATAGDNFKQSIAGRSITGAIVKKIADNFIRQYSIALSHAWAEALLGSFQDTAVLDIIFLDETMLPDDIIAGDRRQVADATFQNFGIGAEAAQPILSAARSGLKYGEFLPIDLVKMIAMRGVTVQIPKGH